MLRNDPHTAWVASGAAKAEGLLERGRRLDGPAAAVCDRKLPAQGYPASTDSMVEPVRYLCLRG